MRSNKVWLQRHTTQSVTEPSENKYNRVRVCVQSTIAHLTLCSTLLYHHLVYCISFGLCCRCVYLVGAQRTHNATAFHWIFNPVAAAVITVAIGHFECFAMQSLVCCKRLHFHGMSGAQTHGVRKDGRSNKTRTTQRTRKDATKQFNCGFVISSLRCFRFAMPSVAMYIYTSVCATFRLCFFLSRQEALSLLFGGDCKRILTIIMFARKR